MESLLRSGTRKERLRSSTVWVRSDHNGGAFQLYLDDRIELPVSQQIHNRTTAQHDALGARECVFVYERSGNDHHYEIRAKLGLDGDRSWYGFQLAFLAAGGLPTATVAAIEEHRTGSKRKASRHILHRPVPTALQEKLVWIAESLFWSLDSPSGRELCAALPHRPLELFDAWSGELRELVVPADPAEE